VVENTNEGIEPHPDNVIDIGDARSGRIQGLEPLLDAVAGAGGAPQSRTHTIPPRVLETLRQYDAAIAQVRAKQSALLEGFSAGLGVDLATENIEFNIDTGVATITQVEKAGV
jgi:hypothetical protein